MIPVKYVFTGLCIAAIWILISRKKNGKPGSWSDKKDVEEYAIIHSKPISLIGDDLKIDSLTSSKKPRKLKKKPDRIIPNQIASIPKEGEKNKQGGDSKGENICRAYLEKKFKTKFSKSRPNFLKNPITNQNLELDCFSESLKLGLEYNGRQHYEYVPVFHKSRADFHNQMYRDQIKKKLCYDHGIDLIEVPYKVQHKDIPKYIDKAIKKLNITCDKP